MVNKSCSEEKAPEMQRLRSKYWTTEEFTEEFNKLKENSFPKVFAMQIDKVAIIVEHWRACHPCELGFNISEYSGTFEEVFLKLAYWPLNRHICKGDYKLGNLILTGEIK